MKNLSHQVIQRRTHQKKKDNKKEGWANSPKKIEHFPGKLTEGCFRI